VLLTSRAAGDSPEFSATFRQVRPSLVRCVFELVTGRHEAWTSGVQRWG
jgi:hypothetical protein